MIQEYRCRLQIPWTSHLQQTHSSSHVPTVASSSMSIQRPFTPPQSTLGLSPPSPSYFQPYTAPDDHKTRSAPPGIQIYVVDDSWYEPQDVVDTRHFTNEVHYLIRNPTFSED